MPPIRDADPRLEYRSNPYRSGRSFGKENLLALMESMRGWNPPGDWIAPDTRPGWDRTRRAWLLVAEAKLNEWNTSGEVSGLRRGRIKALYQEALRAAPKATDAGFLLQELSYEQEIDSLRSAAARGDQRALMRALRRAASNPLHGGGNLILGNELASRGRWSEAIVEFERAIEKSPRSADAHFRLALLATSVRDHARAESAFRTACSLRPDMPPIYRDAARWINEISVPDQ